MVEQVSQFVKSLDPVFLSLGQKPKEGLHILLRIVEKDGIHRIDETSLVVAVHTRDKQLTPEQQQFLEQASALAQLSWCVNTNKCFDLPAKAIHSCSPYCVALKRENLTNGEKFIRNARDSKSQVYERIGSYFAKASELLEHEEDRQRVILFKNALAGEDRLDAWIESAQGFDNLKDSDYVIFYLEESVEKYRLTNEKYLADKLFNTNDYNVSLNGTIFGTSDFFNGFPTKKPFLSHQSASFDIAGRISAGQAKALYQFKEIIGRGILPRPLPIFIEQEELEHPDGKNLTQASVRLFKSYAEKGERVGYRQIIEELYERYREQFGNYYLLFFQGGEIKDFDFVSKFEYELRDKSDNPWRIQDYFNAGYQRFIENVFELQTAVLLPVFNNALVVKTKKGDLQYRYFEDIDDKYCKSENTFLLVTAYRKAFYDFIYKSKREAIPQHSFNRILQISVLDDIRLDEIKNGSHTQGNNIRRKLNIWFSLSEHFNRNQSNSETMGSKLKSHRDFIEKLTKKEAEIETDEQYAFTVGQVIAYLLTKSKTADRSYKRLEPFLQQVSSRELNKAIARLFDSYKHEVFSKNFREPFSQVLGYETISNVRDYMPTMLSGLFSENRLFSDTEKESEEKQEDAEQESEN